MPVKLPGFQRLCLDAWGVVGMLDVFPESLRGHEGAGEEFVAGRAPAGDATAQDSEVCVAVTVQHGIGALGQAQVVVDHFK